MLGHLYNLLYPNLCVACNMQPIPPSRSWCSSCSYKLTPTDFHLLEDNPALQRFWGRINLAHVATLWVFHKAGLAQKLVHQLKYKNRPDIGVEIGKYYGGLLLDSPFYQNIDLIIPVPLHRKKEFQRGYNQAAMFAEGLSLILKKPWSSTAFIRTINSTTQTQKSRLDRFENVKSAFEVKSPEVLKNKHILLVDDVLTTGATLEACALQLLAVEGCKISIVCIALSS